MRAPTALVAILASISIGGAPFDAVAQECGAPGHALTNLGRAVHDGAQVSPGPMRLFEYAEAATKVRYVRLLLRPIVHDALPWQLSIRDSDMRVVETLSHEQVGRDGGLWTRRLYTGGTVYLDLEAASPQMRVEVAKAIVMPENAPNPYYSLQNPGVYAFSPLYEAPTDVRRLGDYVGFLTASWGSDSWCCSGVAVGEDLFLTNWHCGGDPRRMPASGIWSQQVCESTFIDFSWDGDNVDREFTCAQVLDKNEAADFALLRIRPLRGSDRLRAPVLRNEPPQPGERIRIVHHPACRPKQLSHSCSITDARIPGWRGDRDSDFTYPCDTEGGSSGAPVFDERSALIGIHHLGFEARDGVCDKLNKAVAVEAVLGAMKPEHAQVLRRLNRN